MLLTSASARTERNDGQRADACFHQRRVGCLVEFTLDYIENSVVGVRGNILVPVDNLDHCERLAPHRRRLHPIDKVRTREISRTACALSLSSRWCKSKDSTTTSHVPLSNGNARTSARSTTAFCTRLYALWPEPPSPGRCPSPQYGSTETAGQAAPPACPAHRGCDRGLASWTGLRRGRVALGAQFGDPQILLIL